MGQKTITSHWKSICDFFTSKNIVSLYVEKCIMKCCITHGMPQKCLEEINKSQSVSNHNKTHKIVTIVHSKQCLQYKTIMKECKMNCIKSNLDGKEESDDASDPTGSIKTGRKIGLKDFPFMCQYGIVV